MDRCIKLTLSLQDHCVQLLLMEFPLEDHVAKCIIVQSLSPQTVIIIAFITKVKQKYVSPQSVHL